MTVVTIHKAKTNLSKLIEEVRAGGEVVIAKGDTPVARLVPFEPVPKPQRRPGRLKGLISIGPEFFEPLPDEELELWNNPD
jgi:prevent-host-death family protein